jgi:hypothetical protein
MYKGLICIYVLFFWACSDSPVNRQVGEEHDEYLIDLEGEIIFPQHYIAYQASKAIEIDGLALEKNWELANYSTDFIDIEGIKTPKFKTQVKMLWDEHYLYVYAEMEEPHVWGNIKKHDAVIFYNNDFEVFIDPTDDTYNYSEIEVNALNTTWDLRLNKSYRFGGHANDYYEIEGLKTAVHIKGSLNDPSDIDTSWSVEMAIPLEVILQRKRKKLKHPKEGDYWRINFSRVQWEHDLKNGIYSLKKVDGKRLPEYNWVWSNQGAINMHLPEHWGYVEFSENVVGHEKKAQKIPNVLNRQVAYTLLEQIKFDTHKKLLDLKPTKTQKITILNAGDGMFSALFLKTHLGFEIYIENTKTKERFVINEEGKFNLL